MAGTHLLTIASTEMLQGDHRPTDQRTHDLDPDLVIKDLPILEGSDRQRSEFAFERVGQDQIP